MRSNGCASKALNGPKGVNKAELCGPHLLDCIPRGIPPQLGQRLDCDQARMSFTGKYRQSLNRPHHLAAQLGCTRLEGVSGCTQFASRIPSRYEVRLNTPRWQASDGGGVRRGVHHTDHTAGKRGILSSLCGGTNLRDTDCLMRAHTVQKL